MRKEFLPFSSPSISEDDINGVAEVLRSGWITTGKKASLFEKNFSDYTNCKGSVALSSATGGMHLTLAAMGIGPGDEVITPSMTWVSTINMITLAGATPVFADIDKDTLMVTKESVASCLTEKTKLIIPVHFAGAWADVPAISELIKDRDISIVEDAAHALGTRHNGIHVGQTGTAIFSFHPIKNITTGEGGMFCSDNDELVNQVRSLKFHGLGVDAYDRKTQGRAPQAQVIAPGFKYNMTDISAALGIKQLERVDTFNARRKEIATLYNQLLNDVDEILPLAIPPASVTHAWHLFIVRLDTNKAGITRNDFMAELKNRNIGTGLHFRAVHLHKYYMDNMKSVPGSLPNTEWNSDRILSLPLFPNMTDDDVRDVVDTIKSILSNK